jgi:uncharacterized membrane protein YozB (DUF420 family)
MLFNLSSLLVLHAGTPLPVSQLSLTVLLVALGVMLVGVGYGRFLKTKDGLIQHRWALTVTVALSLSAIFFVMLPTFYNFYTDSDLEFFSSMSITTLLHAFVGFPALVSALIYVFGDLPANVKKWMRITAGLWISTVILGIFMFSQMLE